MQLAIAAKHDTSRIGIVFGSPHFAFAFPVIDEANICHSSTLKINKVNHELDGLSETAHTTSKAITLVACTPESFVYSSLPEVFIVETLLIVRHCARCRLICLHASNMPQYPDLQTVL